MNTKCYNTVLKNPVLKKVYIATADPNTGLLPVDYDEAVTYICHDEKLNRRQTVDFLCMFEDRFGFVTFEYFPDSPKESRCCTDLVQLSGSYQTYPMCILRNFRLIDREGCKYVYSSESNGSVVLKQISNSNTSRMSIMCDFKDASGFRGANYYISAEQRIVFFKQESSFEGLQYTMVQCSEKKPESLYSQIVDEKAQPVCLLCVAT